MAKNKNTTPIPDWALSGHRKPITRRELLAHGIIPFMGTLMAPQFLQLLFASSASADAAFCGGSGQSLIPFITLNLSGGAAMASNFIPMNAQGGPIASYSKMGLGDNKVPIQREFGGGTFAGSENGGPLLSKMLQGILETATADVVAKTAFIGVCVRSRDDSAENICNISGLVNSAGLAGSRLPNLGTQNTPTGVRNKGVVINPPTPLIVSSFMDISNSLGYTASLGQQLSAPQREKLTKLLQNINTTQSRKLASSGGGAAVKQMVECAGIKNLEIVKEGSAAVDPLKNADFAGVWNINSGTNKSAQDLVFGSIAFNVLQGSSGAGGLEMGGFDYHNNSRTTGDTRDLGAGRTIGRLLRSAAVLNKPLFLHVTSDGAVVSQDSANRDAPWVSDRGTAGASYIFAFHPAGRPAVSGNQIGSFTDQQVVDDKFVSGNDPALAGQAVFANYLQMNKMIGRFDKLVGRGSLDTDALKKVIKIA